MKARRIAAELGRNSDFEEPVLLECEQSVKINLGMNEEVIEMSRHT
jgi:hypothetical protein